MIKYIDHYGMYSFEEYPFNDVDNTILCQVSYVLFENIIEEDTPYTIAELFSLYFSKYKEEDIKKDKSLIAKAPLVLKEMANSYRYKDIIMHDFINISSDEKSYQFAAMQFDLSDDTTYISFRGTDDQILGWKEDFDMAYKKVPGYMYAKKYINRYCSLFRKYRVGGHSKGGALAIYGSINCFKFKRNNIIHVYSNDGPGINDKFINNKMELIKDRFTKIVPEDDVIGIIFDDDYKHKIVKSSNIGIFQHDMMSWQIDDGEFVQVKSLTSNSRKLRINFNKYIYSLDKKRIVNIIDLLFDFLSDSNITKLSELFNLSFKKATSMLKNIPDVDDESKKIVLNIIRVIIESYIPSFLLPNDTIKRKLTKHGK